MDLKEEQICRLCLNIAQNDVEIIDEVTSEIFETLLLRVNLDISKEPVLCSDCTETLKKCFRFKSTCTRFTLAVDKNEAIFESKDIFQDGKDIETVVDNFICRFCSHHLSGSNFVPLDTLMNVTIDFADSFQSLMPEMDSQSIKSSVICTTCRRDLECYFKFVRNCWEVEEKITEYCESEGIPSSSRVKLSEVLGMRAIKREQALDVKDEPVDSDEIACDIKSNTPEYKLNISSGFESETITREEQKSHNNIQNVISSGIKTDTEIPVFKCAMCAYQTKRKHCLTIHMLVHKPVTELETFKCSMCTFETKQKRYLKRHVLIHKRDKNVATYKCPICTYETKQKYYLKKHISLHEDDTNTETYKCPICPFQAKRKGSLKRHTLIHKDVAEMYKCPMCAHETNQKRYLKDHMLVHKDVTEVETYKCSECIYETKHKRSLRNHVLIHKNVTEVTMYKCAMCTYETKHNYSLKNHTLIHKKVTEVEMYKCSMCCYETKRKYNLIAHIRRHKGRVETFEAPSSKSVSSFTH